MEGVHRALVCCFSKVAMFAAVNLFRVVLEGLGWPYC